MFLDQTDQRKCKRCGRVVFKDEITIGGCLLCEEEPREEEIIVEFETVEA